MLSVEAAVLTAHSRMPATGPLLQSIAFIQVTVRDRRYG
jgi:hypothetical protein